MQNVDFIVVFFPTSKQTHLHFLCSHSESLLLCSNEIQKEVEQKIAPEMLVLIPLVRRKAEGTLLDVINKSFEKTLVKFHFVNSVLYKLFSYAAKLHQKLYTKVGHRN